MRRRRVLIGLLVLPLLFGGSGCDRPAHVPPHERPRPQTMAPVSGWQWVPTQLDLTGPMGAAGLGTLALLARNHAGSCIVDLELDRKPVCASTMPAPRVTAFASSVGYALVVGAEHGSHPTVYGNDLPWPGFPVEEAPAATEYSIRGGLPAGGVLDAVGVDDDDNSPLLAGRVPGPEGWQLATWANLTGRFERITPPGGLKCCTLREGTSVRATGIDGSVAVAADVVAPPGAALSSGVHVWGGHGDETGPTSWTWYELPLASPLDRVSDLVGDILDLWVVGTDDGRVVLQRTSDSSDDLTPVTLPQILVDPTIPTALIAEVSFAADDDVVLAVQAAEGPVVWAHRSTGWHSYPGPRGTLLDAAVLDGTAFLTVRDDSGLVGLWRQRVRRSTLVEDLGGDRDDSLIPHGYLAEVDAEGWKD